MPARSAVPQPSVPAANNADAPARIGGARGAAVAVASVFTAWLALLRAAAQTDPAAVQLLLVVTAAAGIWFGLGNTPRRPGQLSAYSVFNPGCAPLLGQLRAEQFDQEVRHRPTDFDLQNDPVGEIDLTNGDAEVDLAQGGRPRDFGGGVLGSAQHNSDVRDRDLPDDNGEQQEGARRQIFADARRARLAAAALSRRER